ncbi:cytochrome oxidase assembly protein [Halobiforma lacisalsi AJ5]|uniref:Cytochrome oxidase assembly n=1 Tax=Natronobacterium lacisalsi AJ5 TaxID=358396 RepID=M0LKA1_NATLA|nr:COX15/CtaA family protein [Halobiforma lacisalsi]APW98581.1 cytochrome oxidase assembly protein [Halobiforma lacisalsi AJ5]EMA32440.1 cytochrome oxidase assembly [Halobiforma lacisalsi AJ5]
MIDRFGYPHLLAGTLALVTATILLGVAAKATGSGLACQANWPQCDAGPFNLLPANLPSFYEWFHRFVAMFAGFAIIGSALAAWRSSSVDRRVTALVVLGMLLTPVQVTLGRETVTQYTMDILSLHFWTAVLIFSLFVVATVLVWQSTLTASHVTGALGLGFVALPLHVALSPTDLGVVTEYTPTIQLLQYGVTLALLASPIVATMVGRWRLEDRRIVPLLSASVVLAFAVAYLGRQAVMNFSSTLDVVYLATVALLAIAFAAGLGLTRSASSA